MGRGGEMEKRGPFSPLNPLYYSLHFLYSHPLFSISSILPLNSSTLPSSSSLPLLLLLLLSTSSTILPISYSPLPLLSSPFLSISFTSTIPFSQSHLLYSPPFSYPIHSIYPSFTKVQPPTQSPLLTFFTLSETGM